jgi:Lrp/AsnC family leucine-responsive transcriptional regulator
MEVCFASMAELELFVGELQEYGGTRTHVVFSTPVEHRGIWIAEE